jgi:hypothetical protein
MSSSVRDLLQRPAYHCGMSVQRIVNRRREPQTTSLPPLVLDRNEAAIALRISTRKLDYLIVEGEIRPVRIDGRVVIAWAELLRFVEHKSVGGSSARSNELCDVAQGAT